ncbi:DegT/DnrJ/EryC1/StrS family aminotransferase [Desertivirga brevis]|uniref:DegT/DnrJ/EryC1/StrS family aminotransferase n=1 Tax=Desertivirga brevis TaxID=2810310 RepID=UPI001A963C61|nr:DegT/DnrJ/EryC1/StrS family aminotransferase [Pedobacter sp. SYSU D00873]
MKPKILMADLQGQYQRVKDEVDEAMQQVLLSSKYINGPQVKEFEGHLGEYLQGAEIVSCANGTDALQIALMALELSPGDEVIVPSFTYVSCAEVISLLNLIPIFVDVDPHSYTIDPVAVEQALSPRTKAIIAVHLFGQCASMEPLLYLAQKLDLFLIEDTAQALGAEYVFQDGKRRKAGTIGHIGCTSFFPSKILGCFGDGGALITRHKGLAKKARMIANHGQKIKYVHEKIGLNSRLDTLQAAVLDIKLKYINEYIASRRSAANWYYANLDNLSWICLPAQLRHSSHVFNQFTITLAETVDRVQFQAYLSSKGIDTMIYYPIALHKQMAFASLKSSNVHLPATENLCKRVLSLPMDTELGPDALKYITDTIKDF